MTELLDQSSKPAGGFAARAAPALRFLAAGALNSLLSVVVYQAALFVTGHIAAYVVAYVAGIMFAYFAYSRHVFHASLSARRFGLFVLFYIASGCAGTLLNAVLIEQAALHARIAIFLTIAILLPFNYFGVQWCLRNARSGDR